MQRLEDIEAIPGEVLLVKDIAGILKANADTIRKQARLNPASLGFPAIVIGQSVRIPKRAFIAFMKGKVPTGGAADTTQTKGERAKQ